MSKYNEDILNHYGMVKQSNFDKAFALLKPVTKNYGRVVKTLGDVLGNTIFQGLDPRSQSKETSVRLLDINVKRTKIKVTIPESKSDFFTEDELDFFGTPDPEEREDVADAAVEIELKVRQRLFLGSLITNMLNAGKGQATDVGHFEMAVREMFSREDSKKSIGSAIEGYVKKQRWVESPKVWNPLFKDEMLVEIQDLGGKNHDLTMIKYPMPNQYKLKQVTVKPVGKGGFLIEYTLAGKIDPKAYDSSNFKHPDALGGSLSRVASYNQDILNHYGMTKQGRSNPSLSQAFVAVQPVAKDYDRLVQDIEWGIEEEIGDGLDFYGSDTVKLLSLKTKREWMETTVGMTSGSYESPPEEIEAEVYVAVEFELKARQTLSTDSLFIKLIADTTNVTDKREYGRLLNTALKDSGAMKKVEKVILGLAKGSEVDAENAETWNRLFEDQILDEIRMIDMKGANLELLDASLFFPYAYKLKNVSVKFAGKGFLIDYVLVGKIDKRGYDGEFILEGGFGRYASFNNEVLGHYGIQNTEKTAGRGGIDDLEKILGPKKWREITILRRNLHGASPLSTKGADLLWDCIEALARRVQMDPTTTEALNTMRWLNGGHKPVQNMANILDLAKTLGVRANYTTQDLISQFGNRLGYTRILYRQAKSILKKARLLDKVELSGRSSDWSIECPNDRVQGLVMKAFLKEKIGLGGYRTGYGAWVLRQDYQSKGDWNDPSSRHHY